MSDVLIDQDTMEDIGDAIREKLGVSDTYLPASMPAAIRSISGGGGNEMELTKAEYDALSETEKTNGTTYYITDAQSWTSKEVQPVIYSTDEREIGVWTDGKPLYQKSYLNISISKNSWGNSIVVPTDIQIVEIFGYYDTFNSGNYVASFDANSCWDGSTAHFLSYFDNNGHNISFHWNYGGATTANATITIRYTKTTDQVGSGIYTPQGQLAVHYSTDEHVIGTWIDGKTIYEKTLTGLNISATTAWGTQITLISNIDTIIDIKTRDQYGPRAASCQRLDANTFNFKLEAGTATIIILTLRYTKTTD
jgi:hypothetical protein